MPRSRIAALALLFAGPSVGLAQRVAEIDDFLKPIVTKIAADPNVGGWEWEMNRNGGYLLRKLMDVTGDGKPELFVASTLQSSKYEHRWHVFDVAADGTLRPYRTVLEYSSAWPIVESGQTQLIYVLPPNDERLRNSDERPYPVYRFKFIFPDIIETQTYVSEAEAAKLGPPDLGQQPKLEAVLLADYLTKPEAKWTEITDWKRDANDCFFREEDKERAAKNTAFTPEVALSKLGVVQSSSASSSEQTTGNLPPPVVQPPPTKKALSTAPAPPSEEPSSSTPWSLIVVLIVAAIGLLWLVFKRRS